MFGFKLTYLQMSDSSTLELDWLKEREMAIQFKEESDQTHTFLNVYCFNVVQATDLSQTVNES